MLLAHGADPSARDRFGRTPRYWAGRNCEPDLADMLRGGGDDPRSGESGAEGAECAGDPGERTLDTCGEPIKGLGTTDRAGRVPIARVDTSRCPAPRSDGFLETGIKAIDLLAPLPRGGTIAMSGPAGAGLTVTLGECMRRLSDHYDSRAVYVGLQRRSLDVQDLVRGWREQGIEHVVATIVAGADDPASMRLRAVQTGAELARDIRSRGWDALLAVEVALLDPRGLTGALGDLPGVAGDGAITVVLLDVRREGAPADGAESPDTDSRLVFDAALAGRGLYPALDPVRSGSRLLEPHLLGEAHVAVASRARATLRLYRELGRPEPEVASPQDWQLVARARCLEGFLTQSLYVAEAWRGIPGEYVPVRDTIEGVERLLEGRYGEVPQVRHLPG